MDLFKSLKKPLIMLCAAAIIISLTVSCTEDTGNSPVPSNTSSEQVSLSEDVSSAGESSMQESSSAQQNSSEPVSSNEVSSSAPSQSPTSAAVSAQPTATKAPTPEPTEEPYNTDSRNFDFNGPIPKQVLLNFLSRAVTQNGFIALSAYGNVPSGGNPNFDEDFRMLNNIGAKFIGRAAYVWGYADDQEHYALAREKAEIVHDYDPKIILQACIFEAVYKDNVNAIPIPAWVFEEFGLPVENRNFRYQDMIFTTNTDGYVDRWGKDGSIPDITRIETQLWFFYRAARYIDSGYEAIHLGQLSPISRDDPGKLTTAGLIKRIRSYAAENARRKWVLLDAHMYAKNLATYEEGGKTHLLLDFHSFPLRPRDNFEGNGVASDGYQPVRLEKGYLDSVYGRSAGGIHPAGWETTHNPFLCEFDNSGYDRVNRDQMNGGMWPWGYDEATWFARQPENRRSQALTEFYSFINFHYSNDSAGYGFLQMPTSVPLAYPFTVYYDSEEYGLTPFNNIHFFKANMQSPDSLTSFNLENTIKQLWRKP